MILVTRKIIVHVRFDSGSQSSYITEQSCRRLRLESLGTRAMRIFTFGSRQENNTNCTVVNVSLLINNAALDLSRYTQA